MKDPTAQFQLPRQMSTSSTHIDELYTWIWWLSIAFFVAIVGAMVWFAWKYRKRKGHKAEPTGHNLPLEIGWTVAPIPILLLLFHFGFKGYMDLSIAPPDAEEVRVAAKKWDWSFTYKNGEKNQVLHVPKGRPIKLIMSSADVLHAFYVPMLRTKRDIVPGMYTSVWFEATELTDKDLDGNPLEKLDNPDDHDYETPELKKAAEDKYAKALQTWPYWLQCAEYCGGLSPKNPNNPDEPVPYEKMTGHFSMKTPLIIEEPAEYEKWLAGLEAPPGITPEKLGAKLWSKLGCKACHSIDGSSSVGPTWKGLWGKTEVCREGSPVHVEGVEGENYLRESIEKPNARIVQGYPSPSPMPVTAMKPKEEEALIAFIKSLGTAPQK